MGIGVQLGLRNGMNNRGNDAWDRGNPRSTTLLSRIRHRATIYPRFPGTDFTFVEDSRLAVLYRSIGCLYTSRWVLPIHHSFGSGI
jgi:hypothetical protein